MTHDEMIAVIQAHKEGKWIQYRVLRAPDKVWVDCFDGDPCWDFFHHDYRVKPEPLELWAVMDSDGIVWQASKDREAVCKWACDHKGIYRIIRMIEAPEQG